MDVVELLRTQLTDPFRIGLLIALIATTLNTAKATGYLVPLILGGIFVAVLLPTTFRDAAIPTTIAIAVGLVSNALLLAVALGAITLWRRIAQRS
jgi:hypothetical protein